MNGQEKFERFIQRHPHPHKWLVDRPHLTRRQFFQLSAAGVSASFLAGELRAGDIVQQANVATQNRAKNCILILMAGAPSHTDTFDLKMVNGVTPSAVNPATINGILWPTGIFPKLADQIPNLAIVRSMNAWALVHSIAQTWTQIGRNPAAALGNIAPNIGSVVALEKESERTPTQVFPTFLALASASAVGNGYFSAKYAPFKVNPSANGLPNTTNVDGEARVNERWSQLHDMDDLLRVKSPLGRSPEDMEEFYQSARGLMYNPAVDQAFKFSAAESQRYGSTGFGNACLVAKQVLAADQGTRFIQITIGGWDMHSDIYGRNNPRGTNLFTLGKTFDDGVAALIGDLDASGLLSQTLVVMAGEFGRTVGPVTGAGGRDHFLQQSIVFAGAGISGGRAIGATNANGSGITDPGWSRGRAVKTEDVEATIYSAMGINWTTVRYDDPFRRGFEYVPFSDFDLYGPINELWS
ncbi:MAG: DUF1501 domain-containing protein [Acidobacteria bacterium]|nr:DUF1501 domain-containing protein [Acidobacteriota bacterium]